MVYDEWREKNPLRQWRRKTKRSVNETAVLLGVSGTAVRFWESGETRPSSKYMDRISGMCGVPMDKKWLDWFKKSPKIKEV